MAYFTLVDDLEEDFYNNELNTNHEISNLDMSKDLQDNKSDSPFYKMINRSSNEDVERDFCEESLINSKVDDKTDEINSVVYSNNAEQTKSRRFKDLINFTSNNYIDETDNYNMTIGLETSYDDDSSLFDEENEEIEIEIPDDDLQKLNNLLQDDEQNSKSILNKIPQHDLDSKNCLKIDLFKKCDFQQSNKFIPNNLESNLNSHCNDQLDKKQYLKKNSFNIYNKNLKKTDDYLLKNACNYSRKLLSNNNFRTNTKFKPKNLHEQMFKTKNNNFCLPNNLCNQNNLQSSEVLKTINKLNNESFKVELNKDEINNIVEKFINDNNKNMNMVYVHQIVFNLINLNECFIVENFSKFVSKLFTYKDQQNLNKIIFGIKNVATEIITHLGKKNKNKHIVEIMNLLFEHKVSYTSVIQTEFIKASVKAFLYEKEITKLEKFLDFANYFEPKPDLYDTPLFSETAITKQIRGLSLTLEEIYSYLNKQFLEVTSSKYLPYNLIKLTVTIFSLIKSLNKNEWRNSEKSFLKYFSILSVKILNYILHNSFQFVICIISIYIQENVFIDAIENNQELIRKILCFLVDNSQLDEVHLPLEFKILELGIQLGIYNEIKPFSNGFINVFKLSGALYKPEIELIIRRCVSLAEEYFLNHNYISNLIWNIKVTDCSDFSEFMYNLIAPTLNLYSSITFNFSLTDCILIVNQKNLNHNNGIFANSSNNFYEKVSNVNSNHNALQNCILNKESNLSIQNEPSQNYLLNEFQDRNYRDINYLKQNLESICNTSNNISDNFNQQNRHILTNRNNSYNENIYNKSIASERLNKPKDSPKSFLLPTPIVGFERIGEMKSNKRSSFENNIEQFNDADYRIKVPKTMPQINSNFSSKSKNEYGLLENKNICIKLKSTGNDQINHQNIFNNSSFNQFSCLIENDILRYKPSHSFNKTIPNLMTLKPIRKPNIFKNITK